MKDIPAQESVDHLLIKNNSPAHHKVEDGVTSYVNTTPRTKRGGNLDLGSFHNTSVDDGEAANSK